jgi:hypothetical protein
MIEDMTARKLCAGTQRGHIRSCKRFAAFLKRSPDTAALDDVRRFQLHLWHRLEGSIAVCGPANACPVRRIKELGAPAARPRRAKSWQRAWRYPGCYPGPSSRGRWFHDRKGPVTSRKHHIQNYSLNLPDVLHECRCLSSREAGAARRVNAQRPPDHQCERAHQWLIPAYDSSI